MAVRPSSQPSIPPSDLAFGAAPFFFEIVEKSDAKRRIKFGDGQFACGREATNDIVFDNPGVSRLHARFEVSGENLRIVDLGSANGTYVNHARVAHQTVLKDGDTVEMGTTVLGVVALRAKHKTDPAKTMIFSEAPVGSVLLQMPDQPVKELPLFIGDMIVGRQVECDLVVPRMDASRYHARLTISIAGIIVEDLGSNNGTFVQGRRITEPTRLDWGAKILIGSNILEVKSQIPTNSATGILDLEDLRRQLADVEEAPTQAGAVELSSHAEPLHSAQSKPVEHPQLPIAPMAPIGGAVPSGDSLQPISGHSPTQTRLLLSALNSVKRTNLIIGLAVGIGIAVGGIGCTASPRSAQRLQP